MGFFDDIVNTGKKAGHAVSTATKKAEKTVSNAEKTAKKTTGTVAQKYNEVNDAVAHVTNNVVHAIPGSDLIATRYGVYSVDAAHSHVQNNASSADHMGYDSIKGGVSRMTPLTYDSFQPSLKKSYINAVTYNKVPQANVDALYNAKKYDQSAVWKTEREAVRPLAVDNKKKIIYVSALEVGDKRDINRNLDTWQLQQGYKTRSGAKSASYIWDNLFDAGKPSNARHINRGGLTSHIRTAANPASTADQVSGALKKMGTYGIASSGVDTEEAVAAKIKAKALTKIDFQKDIKYTKYRIALVDNPNVYSPAPPALVEATKTSGDAIPTDAVARFCGTTGIDAALKKTPCDRLVTMFYEKLPKWSDGTSVASNTAAHTAWQAELRNPKRSSMIDGAELPAKNNMRSLGNAGRPEVGCRWVSSANGQHTYKCYGMQYLPLAIEGLFVNDSQRAVWDDPSKLERTITTNASPNNCFAKLFAIGLGGKIDDQEKWARTGCPKMRPAAFFGGGGDGNKAAFYTGENDDVDVPPFSVGAAEVWFDRAVMPWVRKNQTMYDATEFTVPYTSTHTFAVYRKLYIDGKPKAQQELYAELAKVNSFLTDGVKAWRPPKAPMPLSPGGDRVDFSRNLWAAFNSLGLTQANMTLIAAGAVPLSYFAFRWNRIELLPLYLVGATTGVVMTSKYNENGTKGMLSEVREIQSRYTAAYERVSEVAETGKREAVIMLNFLKHLLVYFSIAVVGLTGTFVTIRFTAKATGPGAIEVVPIEFLVGLSLTLLVEIAYAIYNGDAATLFMMIARGVWKGGISGGEQVFKTVFEAATN